ncbi:MAG: shikimate kinase, partial [Xanthomonadales bacterium]
MTTRIYLTGFMGCGKSTVGWALAGALGVQFVDLDERIAQSLGATAIAVLDLQTLELTTLLPSAAHARYAP